MTTTWTDIREAMATQIAGTGLQMRERTPLAINDDLVGIIEMGAEGIVPSTHGDRVELLVRVIVIVNRATVTESELEKDDYIWPAGASSIVAAIMADTTLGGIVDDCTWQSSGTPYGTPEGNATGRQSEVQFRCTVRASGGYVSNAQRIVKALSTHYAASASLTSDGELTLPVLAGHVYAVRLALVAQSDGGDTTLRMKFLVPASVTMIWGDSHIEQGASAYGELVDTQATELGVTFGALSTPQVQSYYGIVTAGASGQVTLQFRADVANPGVTVKAGSMIELYRAN